MAGRLLRTAMTISGRKAFCTDLLKPAWSPHAMPLMVPTSFSSSLRASDTCKFSSPEAPISSGTLVSGSINRTLSGVPHLMAICTVLLMK